MSVLNIFKNLSFVEKFTSGGLLDNSDSTRTLTGSDFGDKTQEQIEVLLSSKYSAEILEGIRMLQDVISFFQAQSPHSSQAYVRGRSIVKFLPKILFVLPNPDPEVKQLSHYLTLELLHHTKDKNIVLLSISSLHKVWFRR